MVTGQFKYKFSILRNFTIALLLILSISIAMVFYVSHAISVNVAERELKAEATLFLADLTEVLKHPLWSFNSKGLNIAAAAYFRHEIVAALTVKNSDGEILFFQDKPITYSSYLLQEDIEYNGETIGQILLVVSSDYRESLEDRLMWSRVKATTVMLLTTLILAGLYLQFLLQSTFRRYSALVVEYAGGNEKAFDEAIMPVEFAPLSEQLKRLSISTRRAEMETLENIKLRTKILNETPTGVVLLTESGVLVEANTTFLDYVGYGRAEVVGRSLIEFFEPEYRAEIGRIVEAAKTQEVSEKSTSQLVCKDGKKLLVEGVGRWLRDDEGEILYGIGVISDISKRVAMEKKLSQVEGRYAALFNSAHDGFGFGRLSGEIAECNEALCRMVGYSERELKQLGFFAITPAEYHDQERELLKHVIESGQPAYFEKEYISKDGRRFPVSLSIFSAVTSTGEALGVGAIIRDISKEKAIQDQVKSSEELMRLLLDSSSEGIYGVDINGCVTFCNSSCWQTLGYDSQDELIGTRIHELIHYKYPDGSFMREEDCQVYSAMKAGETVYVDNEVFWRKDGSSFAVEYWSSPMFKGTQVIGAVVFFVDISERKKNEERLLGALNLNHNIISAVPVGLSIYDEVGDCIEANEAIGPIIGASREQVLAQNIYKIGSWQKFGLLESAKEALAKRVIVNKEFKILTSFDKEAYFDCSFIPFYVGDRLRLLFMINDISQRKEREDDLRRALDQKQTLLKEVHHRVKNNLQIVAGMIQLQASKYNVKELKTAFGETSDRIQAMAMLHEEIYKSEDVSSVDASHYLSFLLGSLSSSYQGHAKEIKLIKRIQPITLTIDTLLPVGLIVNELMTNSLKHAFTDKKTGQVVVELSQQEGGRISLAFEDDGVGLPTEVKTDRGDSLGLKIVSALSRQLCAEMSVSVDKGTKFKFVFDTKPEN